MKLAKALKVKNKLAGEIAKSKAIVGNHNSRQGKQEQVYDSAKEYQILEEKVERIAKLKASIAVTNSPVWHLIFILPELKGLVTMLAQLNTTNGTVVQGGSWGDDSPKETEFVAAIKRGEADILIAKLEARIEAVQEELDRFNFTTDVVEG